jgi:hypothetical protein
MINAGERGLEVSSFAATGATSNSRAPMSLQRADRKIASGRSLFKRGLEDACPPICGERASF